jgi:hypothetical protein
MSWMQKLPWPGRKPDELTVDYNTVTDAIFASGLMTGKTFRIRSQLDTLRWVGAKDEGGGELILTCSDNPLAEIKLRFGKVGQLEISCLDTDEIEQ